MVNAWPFTLAKLVMVEVVLEAALDVDEEEAFEEDEEEDALDVVTVVNVEALVVAFVEDDVAAEVVAVGSQ
jgi:hypothetical protein